jgi:hypothetical protein
MNKYFKENGSKLLEEILDSEEEGLDGGTVFTLHPEDRFYFQDEDKYVAVDNVDCQCFVEEFESAKEAIDWLKEYEVEEYV